ncbi:hypothetical protein QP958_04110 [Corynebacterium marquesiae]|uniref:hypothetical protein n=1 Tax=Corynebacterium marquesiae TaxID=2913503 RepID=UPI00254A9DB7|nr:hypothetical protein [Corynebacterium marquesiae]MDK8454589.1 hypothetical protein [Corynebacterium marquesiae]MDK8724706.1 hypothetical protein [Corynebacterium marquesiae]MDK8769949.1 hypothetical protein [Corynebacterium marquesiae]
METTRFGRPKFGGTQTKLITLSVAAGAAIAAAAGALVATFVHDDSPLLAFTVYALCLLPVATTASWLFMVDQSTIRGATPDPENSIESHWYSQASENTLHVMLFGIGGLGVVSSFWDFHVSGSLLTIILGVFVTGTFGISYFAHKRAAS